MAIDHEQRRADIAAITIDLIAREGLAAATIRRIASEADFSTSAITYYFADKQDMLVWAFQVLSEEGEHRFNAQRSEAPDDLIGALLTMVPWCPVNVRRWKAYLAFWDQAARDPELASLLAETTTVGLTSMQVLIRDRVGASADIENASQLLNSLVQGLALRMLVDQQDISEVKVRELLEEAFELALTKAQA